MKKLILDNIDIDNLSFEQLVLWCKTIDWNNKPKKRIYKKKVSEFTGEFTTKGK